MKVAVTGATGFIGRHVLSELKKHPIEVIASTRHSHDETLSTLGNNTIPLDVYSSPNDAFEQLGRPDVLIHLAWGGLSNYKSTNHFEVELPAQYRFLSNMIKSGLQNLFVAGTCAEYGMQSGPLDETTLAMPCNPYGFAKDCLRKQLEYFNKSVPVNLTWGRLFYLYGEGQAEASLLPQLHNAIKNGDSTFNMSKGDQIRDFLDVSIVAKHIVNLSLYGKGLGIINICSGQPISIRSVVEKWIRKNNWKIELNLGHYPYPDYEPLAFWGICEKLNNFINQNESLNRNI